MCLSTRETQLCINIDVVKLTRYEIKTPLVIGHKFDLTGEEVDAGGRFGFICMADIQKALSLDSTPPLLPDPPHLPFRLLQ
jgi:hypothetical protein